MSEDTSGKSAWLFGSAKVDITPEEPIFLAGYLRDAPSDEARQALYTRAAYLSDGDGSETFIVNADVIGYSRAISRRVEKAAQERFGLDPERLILSATHNHSGPVLEGVLPLFNGEMSDGDVATIHRYTERLISAILEGMAKARNSASPAKLEFCSSVAGFATNRRRVSDHLRDQPGIVDHDVPVLVVSSPSGEIRGVLFGYACHTTVMYDNVIDGDYSGYAQRELETQFPECTAIFLAGCGADANPMPRRRVELSISYGKQLACAVQDALASGRTALPHARIRSASRELHLPLAPVPTRDEFEELLEEQNLRARVLREQFQPMPPGYDAEGLEHQITMSMRFARREIRHQLDAFEAGGPATFVPYPIKVLELGGVFRLIALAGEPVAEYSLRLKERFGFLTTWPLGYCQDLTAYIPSKRVLREGGYEGASGMRGFGWPTCFQDTVEEEILSAVAEMIQGFMTAPASR